MRLHRFAFILISTTSRCPIARTELSLDGPLEDFNTNEADPDIDASLFDQVKNPNLPTEDNLFNLNDGSDMSLFADNPSVCLGGSQPPSRIRGRAEGYCVDGEHPDQPVPGADSTALGAATTQEELNKQNCPSDYYQGIFIIPICSQYDNDLIRLSGPFEGNNVPLSDTGMKDVWGSLITPASEAFSPCFPNRRWCCQSWIPKMQDFPTKYGYGLWCVQGPNAKFVNPLDMFPPAP